VTSRCELGVRRSPSPGVVTVWLEGTSGVLGTVLDVRCRPPRLLRWADVVRDGCYKIT